MTHDEFAQYEEDHRDLIGALQQLSQGTRASPGFLAAVIAQAEQLPIFPRQGLMDWVTSPHPRPVSVMTQVAVVGLFVFAIIGAIPQYALWIKSYAWGVPADAMYEARQQERLWKKNFACAAQIDHSASNYAALTGEWGTVVVWACPSGDVQVTVEAHQETLARRSVWIALDAFE
jgi:hypothetical protein